MADSTFTVKARDLQGALESTSWLEPLGATRGEKVARNLTELVDAAAAVLDFDSNSLQETPLEVTVSYDAAGSAVSVSVAPTVEVVGETVALSFDASA